jgi:hypothetical protein
MSFVTVAIIGVSAFQQVQAGKYAKGQANLQAQQMDYQAQVENDNALKTAAIIRRAGRKQVGQANAAYAGPAWSWARAALATSSSQITYGRRARRLPGAAGGPPARARHEHAGRPHAHRRRHAPDGRLRQRRRHRAGRHLPGHEGQRLAHRRRPGLQRHAGTGARDRPEHVFARREEV